MIIISKVKMLITVFDRILSQWDKDIHPLRIQLYNLIYETQGKVQTIRPYIDSCAVVGSTVKTYQTKTYPSQNVPSWSQNLLK